jgi:hypothetical protein
MNGRLAKRIHKQSRAIATEWLKSMLSDVEAAKVTVKNLPNTNAHTYLNDTAYSMPYSLKGSARIIKMIIKRNPLTLIEDITAATIAEYIRTTKRS